jgi:outer membrane lipoprotein-sorting protein
MTSADYRLMGGRLVPTRTVVRPADKPNEHTTITYRNLEFNVPLPPSFFSLRSLQAAGPR